MKNDDSRMRDDDTKNDGDVSAVDSTDMVDSDGSEDDSAAIDKNKAQILSDVKDLVSQYHVGTVGASNLASLWDIAAKLPKLLLKMNPLVNLIWEDIRRDLKQILKRFRM